MYLKLHAIYIIRKTCWFKYPTGVYYWNESETNLEMLPKIPTYMYFKCIQNILLSIFCGE